MRVKIWYAICLWHILLNHGQCLGLRFDANNDDICQERTPPHSKKNIAQEREENETLQKMLKDLKDGWFDSAKYPKLGLTPKQQDWVKSLVKDANLKPQCVRKEYRVLTDDERNALHDAYLASHNTYPDDDSPLTEYMIFVIWHRLESAPAAHQGPAFLPWHRHFLYLFEQALRTHDPSVCLAYWDSTMDHPLPDPSDSGIWTDAYLGNKEGIVTTGFAKNWSVIDVCPFLNHTSLYRQRATPQIAYLSLYAKQDIDWMLTQGSYDEISCTNYCKFETDHGGPHGFVGGQMRQLHCSPSDPVFFMHHAYVDYAWQLFRDLDPYPGPVPPDMDYGTTVGTRGGHEPDDPMLPWEDVMNIDGMSNEYSDYYHTYDPSPGSCDSDSDCRSTMLWCDPVSCRCLGKVHQGGNCTTLPDTACAGPCENGTPGCDLETNLCRCL